MSYVLLYAPAFPDEDGTSLQRERDRLTSLVAEHRTTLRTDDQMTWHRLAEEELTRAFEAFAAGDGHTARSQLQRAEEHFRRSFQPRKIRPHFVVAPDGQITKT